MQRRDSKLLKLIVLLAILFLIITRLQAAQAPNKQVWSSLIRVERDIPKPIESHPGNIYLDNEKLQIEVPPATPMQAVKWQMFDDKGKLLKQGKLEKSATYGFENIKIGKMPVGWYKIKFYDNTDKELLWTTAAVLKKLKAPTPMDSPICLDLATAWFGRNNPVEQQITANLATLAGVNWGRDRMKWGEMEPQPNFYPQNTTYDMSATIQAQAGLKTLQAFHDKPSWAEPVEEGHGRFPADLRHLYRFCKKMAQRYKGRVQAWEPWNEANAGNFGGQTIDEMCTMQKAAYLGFKAGDQDVIVCWNAYGGISTDLHTKGVLENQAWSYFDTYNTHSYAWDLRYYDLWKPVRQAACGRPIWLTESDRGIKYQGDSPW